MSELRKELGKIKSISFGYCGYNDAMIGLKYTLEGKSWETGNSMGGWDAELIKCDKHCKWTEADRDKDYAAVMRYVSKLLKQAKVTDISQLKGIPIEATFDVNCLEEWRILEEVL
jgi:hypothetical protein